MNFHLKKYISLKKIVYTISLMVIVGVIIFYQLWDNLFFPDDYYVTKNLAEKKVKTPGPQAVDFDLFYNLDKITYSPAIDSHKINDLYKKIKKNHILIKREEYIKSNLNLFRVATGHLGIWLDERSSLLMPAKSSISFEIDFHEKSYLNFAALSIGLDSDIEIKVVSLKDKQTWKRTVNKYIQKYSNKDAKSSFINIGYEKALDDKGWRSFDFDLNRFSKRKCKIIIKNNGNKELFLSNFKIYKKQLKKRYNVIYLLFDGVASKYWSFYNEKSGLTPFMKEKADESFIVFDNMYSLGNKTRISTCGLFTSQLPFKTRHGINRNFIPREEIDLFYSAIASGKFSTLPDVFRRNGYISTQFGNSGFTVDLLTTGVDYGFERSYEFSYNPYDSFGSSTQFFKFLQENKERDFFAYCHYNTPHKPFFAPAKYYLKGIVDSPIEGLWRPDMTGTLSYTDDVFKNIYLALKTNNLLENTIVIIATDHGSGYDLLHFDGGFHYDDFTKLTFLMYLPSSLKRQLKIKDSKRNETIISSINIAPTIMELAGIKPEKLFSGKSFLPVLQGNYNNEMWDEQIWSFGRKTLSLIDRSLFKYILTSTDARRYVSREHVITGNEREVPFEQLYDLKNDNLEHNNLVKERTDVLKKMRQKYLEADIHHPEKNIISFVSHDKESDIQVRVKSSSVLLRAELYNSSLNEIKNNLKIIKNGSNNIFKFKLGKDPVSLIFEFKNDRASLVVDIRSNGKLINKSNIYVTPYNINLLSNPVLINNNKMRKALYDKKTALQQNWTGNSKDLISVKYQILDLHRWIDIKKLEDSGIAASMKETLKSWGYIQ